ncbi:MBL fold metallo-hydrolase [Alkalicoccus chagannorensis]|uniref:MBL fold metallo-hydrolase n=1 Tax=Alkalicoccus chagannorensis TaxID=427072 RepID=UPI00041AF750|nr:MBL fold metallo-hydrolase [Alkalicoccus chagannorensis]
MRKETTLCLVLMMAACGSAEENGESPGSQKVEETPQQNTDDDNEDDEEAVSEGNLPDTNDNADQQDGDQGNADPSEADDPADAHASLEVHFIDAGQADATLFIMEDGTGDPLHLLLDAGHWQDLLVVEYLDGLGIEHLDVLASTHPHADHIGQMDSILGSIDVGEVWMSGDEHDTQTFAKTVDAVEASGVRYEEPRRGDVFDLGPLTVNILHPERVTGDFHEGSLAASFTFGNHTLLFTGDAEAPSEVDMLEADLDLEADVLQLGHHGSSTSTIPSFLEAVDPAAAVASAGVDNQYGHPHEEVLDLLQEHRVDVYGTYSHGTIVMRSDGDVLDVETERSGDAWKAAQGDSQAGGDGRHAEGCISLNDADADELEDILHIGPARAEEIIAGRGWDAVEQLTKIDGIGDQTIEEILEEGAACVE